MLFNNSPNDKNDFLIVRFYRAESPECDLEREVPYCVRG